MSGAHCGFSLRCLVLEGSSEEMGYQHGCCLREEIGAFLDAFLFRAQEVIGLPYAAIRAHAASLQSFIPPALEAEMRALAEGAGQPYVDVLSLNTFPDTDALHQQKVVQCVNFAAAPDGMTPGRIYHARNFDFPHEGRHWRHTLLIGRRPSGQRPATLSLGWVGQVGVVTGLNQSGLMLGEVTAYPRRTRSTGMPVLLALRSALEAAGRLEDGIAALKGYSYMAGLNVLISSGAEGKAASCELSAEGVEVVGIRGGHLCISGVCQSPTRARGQQAPVSDVVRHLRTLALLRQLPPGYTEVDLQAILQDSWDDWAGKPGSSYRCICNYHTIHSVVLDWRGDACWIAAGKPPAPLNGYARLRPSELFALPSGLHRTPNPAPAAPARPFTAGS